MSIRRPTFATPVAVPVAALVALLLAVLWLAWQTAPALAVASALDRILAGTAASRDLDTAALPASLAPQIERILADEQATARRWAAAGTAMRGTAAAFHLVASLPVLVMEPLAPRAAASVKRTQAALRPEPAPPPPDTAKLAGVLAGGLVEKQGTAALLRAAFQRAPETWPDTRFGQVLFVGSRLQTIDDGTWELALEPAGIAFGWRNRLTVLQFRRSGPWQWTLNGIRLPPSPHHARALLDAAQPVERQASTP